MATQFESHQQIANLYRGGKGVRLDHALQENSIIRFRSSSPWIKNSSHTHISLMDDKDDLILYINFEESANEIFLNTRWSGEWGDGIRFSHKFDKLFPVHVNANFSVEYYDNWFSIMVDNKPVAGMTKRWDAKVTLIGHGVDSTISGFSNPIEVTIIDPET